MPYCVVFDNKGKYMGYSDDKLVAENLIKQRKSFQKLQMRKLKKDMLNEKMRKDLFTSGGEIFDYFGTYLFEHEQDEIHNNCYDYYSKCYESVETYMQLLKFIKLNDEEKEKIGKFTKDMLEMVNLMQDDYYGKEDPYSECFKVNELVIHYLKEMYKGEKEK